MCGCDPLLTMLTRWRSIRADSGGLTTERGKRAG
jgi:hypothetical protein